MNGIQMKHSTKCIGVGHLSLHYECRGWSFESAL